MGALQLGHSRVRTLLALGPGELGGAVPQFAGAFGSGAVGVSPQPTVLGPGVGPFIISISSPPFDSIAAQPTTHIHYLASAK